MATIASEKTDQRKIRVVFVLAILLPSLAGGFLSWSAVAKRREALKRIVESQLWISGERAVRAIEASLQEHEIAVLSADRFLPTGESGGSPAIPPGPTESGERIFLLDPEFRVLFPRAGGGEPPYELWAKVLPGSPFVGLFERAEYWAFVRKDYDRAADLYSRSRSLTEIARLQAFAWEGLGRCLFFSERDGEAASVYAELLDRYGRLKNRSGHPYGPLAALQLYEIAKRQGHAEASLEGLVRTYEMLEDGAWALNRSTHDFYVEEMARALENGFADGKHPDLEKHFEAVRNKSSVYLEELAFAAMVEENVVPIIKEKIAYSQYANAPPRGAISPDGRGVPLSHLLFAPGRHPERPVPLRGVLLGFRIRQGPAVPRDRGQGRTGYGHPGPPHRTGRCGRRRLRPRAFREHPDDDHRRLPVPLALCGHPERYR